MSISYDQALALSQAMARLGMGMAASNPSSPQYAMNQALANMGANEQARRNREKEEEERKKQEKGGLGGLIGGTGGSIGGAILGNTILPGVGGVIGGAIGGVAGSAGGTALAGGSPTIMGAVQGGLQGGMTGYGMYGKSAQAPGTSPGASRSAEVPSEEAMTDSVLNDLPSKKGFRVPFTQRLSDSVEGMGGKIYNALRNYGSREAENFNIGGMSTPAVPSVTGRFSTIGMSPEQQNNAREMWLQQSRTEQDIRNSQVANRMAQRQDSREQGRYEEEMSNAPLRSQALSAGIDATRAGTEQSLAEADRTRVETISPQERASLDMETKAEEIAAQTAAKLTTIPYETEQLIEQIRAQRSMPQAMSPEEAELLRAQAEQTRSQGKYYEQMGGYYDSGGSQTPSDSKMAAQAAVEAQQSLSSNPFFRIADPATQDQMYNDAFNRIYNAMRGRGLPGTGAAGPDNVLDGMPGVQSMPTTEITMPDGTRTFWAETPDGKMIRVK
jgi:hypothetical protein